MHTFTTDHPTFTPSATPPPASRPLTAWVDDFLHAAAATPGLHPETVKRLRWVTPAFVSTAGERPATELTRDDLDAALRSLGRESGAQQVKAYRPLVRRFLRFVNDRTDLALDVSAARIGLAAYSPPDTLTPYLTVEAPDYPALHAAQVQLATRLALVGLTTPEMVELRVDDLTPKRINVSGRDLPAPAVVGDAVKDFMAARAAWFEEVAAELTTAEAPVTATSLDDGALLRRVKARKPHRLDAITVDALGKAVRSVQEAAGLPPVPLTTFRQLAVEVLMGDADGRMFLGVEPQTKTRLGRTAQQLDDAVSART